MKKKRQSLILEIINSTDIETQEELAEALKNNGILAKQSTLSRDIKELRLTKVLSNNKRYKYTTMITKPNHQRNRLLNLLENTVNDVERVDKLVIITTISGSASGAAEAIDNLGFKGIVGTVAGDNNILIILRTEEEAENVVNKIKPYINKEG